MLISSFTTVASTSNQEAFIRPPELRTELRRGNNQLKKLVLLRPVKKYGFCSLGILEAFITRLLSSLFGRVVPISYS
jgi:hypothetical protein